MIKYPANLTKSLGPVWADQFSIDLDLVGQLKQRQTNHFGKRKCRNREIHAADSKSKQANKTSRQSCQAAAEYQSQPEWPSPQSGGYRTCIGADAEESLLSKGDLSCDQQQVSRQCNQRNHPDIRDDRQHIVIKHGYTARRSDPLVGSTLLRHNLLSNQTARSNYQHNKQQQIGR